MDRRKGKKKRLRLSAYRKNRSLAKRRSIKLKKGYVSSKPRLKELSEKAANPAESSEAPQEEPEPEPIPEPRKAFKVPSPSELTEGRGKRSCSIQQCAFRSCPTNDSPELRNDVTFFRFPRVFSASQKWARTVSRERGEQFAPQFTSVVCALHFRNYETFIDSRGRAAVLPNARPRAEPYTQEEQEKEQELFDKLQEETVKKNEESEREQKKRPRTSKSEDRQEETVEGNEENERGEKKRPKKIKNVKRQEEIAKRKEEREREKKRIREENKRIRKSKKTVEVILPSFVPEVPNLELYGEINTTVDSFGNALPVERNPLKIEATTELERAVQSIADELKPAENAITLQYLDMFSKSATVHFLSVDSGNIVSVGHTQVNIQKDNIATLNYVDGDNTVKHTLRCVNIENDPSMSALTENETSANDRVVKTEAPDTNSPDISDSINLFTDNPSISKCIIKEEPVTNDESDPNVTNDETIVEVTEGTIKVENESDGSDTETVVKMEIEEFDEQVFKLF